MNVICPLVGAVVELTILDEIRKYKRFHEGHHFISVAMEVHGAPDCDMDHFIRECGHFFTIDNWEVIYPCLFAFNFSSTVLVLLFNVL